MFDFNNKGKRRTGILLIECLLALSILSSGCEKQEENHGQIIYDLTAEFIKDCPERPTGNLAAAKWLQKKMPNAKISTHKTKSGVTVNNVISEKPGEIDEWIVLLSHFDTKTGIENFTGANDGASSSALLVHFANTLKPKKYGLIFAQLDGEECVEHYTDEDGLHGSSILAETFFKEKKKLAAVILCDMIGDSDLIITPPVNSTPKLVKIAKEAAEKTGVRLIPLRTPMIDDHVPFLRYGFPAIDLIDFNYGPQNSYWHTAQDSMENISATSLNSVYHLVSEMIEILEKNSEKQK